jgi:hypothetical protein
MKESIRAMNYVVESNGAMRGRQIGVCDWLSPRFSPLVNNTVVWPGGVQELPSDSAVTPAPQGFSTSWLLAGAFATALVVMIGLVMLVRRKKALLQGILLMLLTEVGQLVFSECTAMANTRQSTRRSCVSGPSQQRSPSALGSETSAWCEHNCKSSLPKARHLLAKRRIARRGNTSGSF